MNEISVFLVKKKRFFVWKIVNVETLMKNAYKVIMSPQKLFFPQLKRFIFQNIRNFLNFETQGKNDSRAKPTKKICKTSSILKN